MTDYNVVATLRVTPKSPEVDKDALKKGIEQCIPSTMKLHKIEEEPIAFGLVAFNVFVLLNENEGGVEGVEKKIKEIKDVSQADVTDARKLL